MKALLPTHAGKIDCIFIDPPYNTGNEGWCYNDNVRSPLMKEWLKKSANPVDKEDLERHDKWLCMMWPRLNLLRELLSDKGAIIVTLDDNEIHHMRSLMDEIFGEQNFIATCLWQKNYSPKNTAEFFSSDHDYILIYAKNKMELEIGSLDRTEEQENRYKNPDSDPRGPWKTSDLSARNPYSEGLYAIKCPGGRLIDGPPTGRYWTIKESKLWDFDQENRIWWGKDKNSVPQLKRFLHEIQEGRVPQTIWFYADVGHTDQAKKELKQIMSFDNTRDVFITPKPVKLVERVLQIFSKPDSIVLDSFAGSGTTAHAILKANEQDSVNCRFILVECEDYADTLTAERVRRVINGYSFSGTLREELYSQKLTWSNFSKKSPQIMREVEHIETTKSAAFDKIKKEIKDGVLTVTGERKIEETAPGLGGSFTYCTLGEPIEIETLLTGKGLPSFESLARYVFYTATGQALDQVAAPAADGFIGETELFRIHLFYQPDANWLRSNDAALNAARVDAIEASKSSGKRAIVFAVAKFMSQKELTKKRIEFCQLPYAVHRILGD
ncbi:site-specific DNA-methyltransferase [Desulfuromonas acetoxidans]|uniref:site-specific DNA-methyltransferase n=1 Tax=Desulfuromonas acetoxidans TaxID=891 RepID=UPI0029314AD2|nr:site-specific DNA-methyltransferase [Desulfuromonas acetoxidans]